MIRHILTITQTDTPIGSIWETDVGTRWKVIAHDGERVTVERIDRPGDRYVWNFRSLTQTTARRIEPLPIGTRVHVKDTIGRYSKIAKHHVTSLGWAAYWLADGGLFCADELEARP